MSIRLSPKHGVNPSLALCFYCGEENGSIVLPGLLRGDVEAPRRAVWDHNPCDTCRDMMARGVMLIQVRNGEEGGNPFRTGPMCVVTDTAIRRLVNDPALAEHILKCRWSFVPQDAWLALGLPESPTEPESGA